MGVVAVTVLLSGKSSHQQPGDGCFFFKHGMIISFADPGWLIWDYA